MKHIDRNNIVDISANTENSNFPIDNVLDLKPGRKYKTPTGEWVSEIAADCTIGVSDIVVAGTNATQATVSVDDPNVFEFAGDWEWGGDSSSAYPAIDATVESSADIVDVFIYDTRDDSDGGAWVDSATTQSWYAETLNTATRGASRAFPKVALIVAQTTRVTIYDMTSAGVPMWMVFNRPITSASGTVWPYNGGSVIPIASSIQALNGILCVSTIETGSNSLYSGVSTLSFINDSMKRYATYSGVSAGAGTRDGLTIIYRNDASATLPNQYTTQTIVNADCNDVAMTILDSAPIDPATGIAVPTIAVATDGGVSVIDGPAGVGTVVDLTWTAEGIVGSVEFVAGKLKVVTGAGTTSYQSYVKYYDIPSTDTPEGHAYHASVNDLLFISSHSIATGDVHYSNGGTPTAVSIISGNAIGNNHGGLSLVDPNFTTPTDSAVAYITNEYNTGWMQGDIKLATLADSVAETITSSDTVADRSVNANDLSVVGTLAKSAVATGAELMAYSGFSAANYIEQPYNSDLDFGTGDFYVMLWIRNSSGGSIFDRRTSGPVGLSMQSSSGVYEYNIGAAFVSTGVTIGAELELITLVRESGHAYFYRNGVLEYDAAAAGDADPASNIPLWIGQNYTQTSTNLPYEMALFRIGSGAPSADQIAKIYNDERELFAENAQCLLPSASVTALSYDKGRDRLTVGTDSGLASFSGLVRYDATDNTFDTAQTVSSSVVAVSSYASRHAIATDAQSYAIAPSIPIIDQDEWGNVPLTVTGTATQDFINKCLWIELSESVNVPCELSIKLFGPSGEPLEVGVIQAGVSQTYGNRNPRYGLQKTQNDYSISHQLSNGNTYYKLRNIARVFSASAIMTRANTRLMEQFFKRWGQQPTGWRLTDEDSNDFVVFGRVSGVSITDSYPNHSEISWTITEVL